MTEIEFSQSYYLKRAALLGIPLSLSTEIMAPQSNHLTRKNIVTDGKGVHIATCSSNGARPGGIKIIASSRCESKHRRPTKPAPCVLPMASAKPRRWRDWEMDDDVGIETSHVSRSKADCVQNAKYDLPIIPSEAKEKKERNNCPHRDRKDQISSHGRTKNWGSEGDVAPKAASNKTNPHGACRGKSWMIVTEKMMKGYQQ